MVTEKEYPHADEDHLHFLTERQRSVWLLHEDGLSRKQIAEKLGISYNTVVQHLKLAVQHFREYDHYCEIDKQNQEIVDFPLTRGEVKIILNALTSYASKFEDEAVHRIDNDTYGRLSIEATILADLLQKAQILILGKSLHRCFTDTPY